MIKHSSETLLMSSCCLTTERVTATMQEHRWRILYNSYLILFYIFTNFAAANGDKSIKFERERALDGFTCPDEHVIHMEDNLSTSQCLARCADSPTCFGLFRYKENSRCVGCQEKYLWTDNAVTSSATIFYRRPSYKVIKEGMTFYNAKNYCRVLGGHLLDETNKENLFIQKIAGTEYVWLGATDLQREGVFVWEDGSKLSHHFENWTPGEPTNSGNIEHCSYMVISTGKWNDWGCSNQLEATVCEFN